MSPADADLLLAAYGRSGNARDLAALFDATAPELFRVALATAPDAASAEDALQETFLTVMDAAPRFDATRRALPWLVGILRFKVAALRSRRFRSRGADDTPPPPLADAPTDGEADPDELARVRAEIEHLSEPYRSVALLRWRYGLSPAEIAHVRGEPPGTVRSILSRSLERLRRGMRAVPAFFFGTRTERGLDGVRAHLLATATAKPGVGAHTAASTAARAWIAGSVAAGLLLTGAIVSWISWGGGGGGGVAPPAGEPTPPVLAAEAAEEGNPPGLAGAGGNPRGMVGAAGAVRIRGTCVDIDRKPLAGAHLVVAAEIPDDDTTRELSSLPSVGTSREDGAFEIGSPHAASRVVAFTDDGRFGLVSEARAGIEVEVVLRSPRTLTGRTVDETGQPVRGARVLAHRFFGGLLIRRETLSGPDGTFSFSLPSAAVPALDALDGEVYLVATERARGACSRAVDLKRPGSTVTLELGQPTTWAVTVTQEGRGAPVVGAEVTAYGDLGAHLWIAGTGQGRSPLPPQILSRGTTDDFGRVLLPGLPLASANPSTGSGFTAPRLALGVRATGLEPQTVPLPQDAPEPIRFAVILRPPTDSSTPEVTPVDRPVTRPTENYPFLVVDDGGVGIAAAHLAIESMGTDARTDATGTGRLPVYRTPESADAKPRVVTVSALGYLREVVPLPPAPPTSPLRIALHRGGAIRGRVLEADGAPASGCEVSAFLASTERPPTPSLEARVVKTAEGNTVTLPPPPPATWDRVLTRSDEAGWFRLEGIGERPMVVVAERPSRKPAATATDRVRAEAHDVRAGASALELRLPREVLPPSARVVVTVVDEETGEPVAAQYVRFRRGDQAIMVLAEGPGRMRGTQVPVGAWRVRVMAEGYPMHVVPFVVREGDVERPLTLRIGRGLARRGEVRTPEDAAWGDRKLWFSAIDATPAVGSVDAVLDGSTWKATSFRPGRYRALAVGSGERWIGREPIIVEPGVEQAPFEVELVAAGSLRVVAPRAAPAIEEEYAVRVTTPDAALVAERAGLSLAQGAPLLPDEPLPPGTYAVRVTRPDGTFHAQTVTIRAQETVEVDVP